MIQWSFDHNSLSTNQSTHEENDQKEIEDCVIIGETYKQESYEKSIDKMMKEFQEIDADIIGMSEIYPLKGKS